MTYAGFWKRLLAFLLDQIILGFVRFIIFIPFWIFALIALFGKEPFNNKYHFTNTNIIENEFNIAALTISIGLIILFGLFNLIAEWLYFALMESSAKQATVGKIIVGIKVTDLAGNRISFAKASGRYFGKIISGLILMIGFIMAAFTERKQALHDIFTSSLVINSFNFNSYSSPKIEGTL